MKVHPNIFNLSDKPVRYLQIYLLTDLKKGKFLLELVNLNVRK